MAKPGYDGVIEAVHYDPAGKVAWVRVYERRGPTFSDRLIVDRETLIKRLQAGRKYVVGRRVPLMAGTFETSHPVHYFPDGRDGVLVCSDRQAERDTLAGVPVV